MMNKKIILILNIIILAVIFLAILTILIVYITSLSANTGTECTDPFSLVSLKYSACYNENLQSVMLTLSRESDNYNINRAALSFIDSFERKISIKDIPKYNEIKKFNFTASQNPGKAKISIDIATSVNLCSIQKTIILNNCTTLDISSKLSGITSAGNTSQSQQSDTLPIEMFKGYNLASMCDSGWSCSNWEECIDGIQKRDCQDLKNCPIPTNTPDFTKYCNTCKEDWQCQWSTCKDGWTTPECTDRNRCQTEFSKPNKLPCFKNSGSCNPNIACEAWSTCNINLDIIDFTNLQNIKGKKTRICRDMNNCILPSYESQTCSTKINIYTKEIDWNGEQYLEVYDNLTDKLLSRVKYSSGSLPSLDLNFYLQ